MILFVTLSSLFVSGCVVRERTIYRSGPPPAREEVTVAEAPPPPIIEKISVSPGPGFVWIGGAWVWRGHWVWERGHWVRPPRVGAIWVPHRYEYRNGVHIFIRGGWR